MKSKSVKNLNPQWQCSNNMLGNIRSWRMEDDSEELEQYGRRLCLRIEGVPSAEKETSEEVLEKELV